ncbi:MAG: ribonuclease D [Atopobiaceae bacterium]
MYIHDSAELEKFCEYASQFKVIAVDTEFLRETTYYPKLCLVQVAAGERIAAIDPIEIKDCSALVRLLEDSSITKVLHACGQDLEVIYVALGCKMEPVFDTQIAAAFLGKRMQMGYGALVEAYRGIRLPKAESLTDWSKRPLDPEQLRYAEDDVRYLVGIYEEMMQELVRRNRLSWLLPELQAHADPRAFIRDPREAYIHLKRVQALTRTQLAVAREVSAWREERAAARNIPRRWLLSDELVIEICKRVPKTVEDVLKIRGTKGLGAQDAASLLEAVSRGRECPKSELPELRRHARPSHEVESVVDLLLSLLRIDAEKADVAPQLIATKDELVDFAQGKPSPLDSGWRYEIAGKDLSGLMRGELGLTVKDGKIEIL